MKPGKIIYLSALSVLLPATLHAQYGISKKEDVDAVKSRTLIVVTEEPKPELMEKLTDDEKTFYKGEIDSYNALMRELAPKYWRFSKTDFKTRTEVNALVKAKSKEFAYIEFSKFRINFANGMSTRATMSLTKPGGGKLIGGDYSESSFDLRLTESNPLGLPVYGLYMPSVFPAKGDIVFGLKQIQLQLKYKSEGMKDMGIATLYKQNANKMQTFTLLIDTGRTTLSEQVIKESYPFPYLLVGKERIEQAFLNEETGTAAFVFIPRAGRNETPYVVDTNEGTEMVKTSTEWTTGVSVSTPMSAQIMKEVNKGMIRKDDLKIIAKQIGKTN